MSVDVSSGRVERAPKMDYSSRVTREKPPWSTRGGASVFGALAVVAGLLVGWRPILVVIPVFCIVLSGFRFAWFRLGWFAIGAFLVFQATGDGLNAVKSIYLFGVAVSVLIALFEIVRSSERSRSERTALLGAALLVALLLASLIYSVGVLHIAPVDWARDALTYLLISAGIILACDGARSVSYPFAVWLTTAIGVMAAVGFATAWIGRRGLADIDQFLLSSMSGLIVPIALFIVKALVGRGVKLGWLALALGMMLAVLLSGSRTSLVLPLMLLAAVGSASKFGVPIGKALISFLTVISAALIALPLVASFTVGDDYVQKRFSTVLVLLDEGLGADKSGQLRALAYSTAQGIFNQNPFLGQGVGQVFPSLGRQITDSGFTLDTPWIFPAKFGVVGTAWLFVALVVVMMSLSVRMVGRSEVTTIMRCAVAGWIILLPFGSVVEDKGFALGVMSLVLLSQVQQREARRRDELLGSVTDSRRPG